MTAQRALIKQAQLYYEQEDYQRVIESLIDIEGVQKYDKAVRMLAVAFTRRGQSAAAVPLLQSYLQDIPEDGDMIRTLAEAQFLSGDYEEAAETYKYYLGKVDVDEAERQEIMLNLLHCQSAIKYRYLDQYGYAENLGTVVNSSGDDILPLTSQNHSDRYYFSSNRPGAVGGMRNDNGLKDQKLGKYYHDMYRLDINNGGYASVAPIAPLLNSSAHDYVSGFNESGEVLLFVKDQGKRGAQLLSDTFTMDRSLDYYPLPIELPVVPSAGDRDIQLVHDTILLFSSMREGGQGGYDLWVTIMSDSTWSDPTNLGPTINSAFDEVGGFMTVDGLQLFYASNRPSSCGGLDIFKQRFSLESRTWGPAENLVSPINSSGDDVGFALSQDGSKAMISSNRGGGYGGFDLYFIYLKESIETFGRDVLVLEQRLATESLTVDSVSADQLVISDVPDAPLPTKEIVMPLQQYDGTVGLSDPKVKKSIATIADAILVYPGTQVLIRSKVPMLGDYSREIFFALKQGEEVIKGLLAKGVPKSSVFIEGLPSTEAQYSFSPSLWSQSEVLKPLHLDPAQADVEGLTFRVLYRSVTQMLQSDLLPEFGCTISKDPGKDAYQIHTAPTRSYTDAKRMQSRLLRAEPVAEATILPFMQGIPLSYDRIVDLATEMPELRYYLEDK